MDALTRAPLLLPLSPQEAVIVDLLGVGLTYEAIAQQLALRPATVRRYTNRAAFKIPGDLPVQMRCIVWARGGAPHVLTGDALKVAMLDRANAPRASRGIHSVHIASTQARP